MKNRGIIIFLVVLALIIVAVIAGDFINDRPDHREGNPYEFSVDEYKTVDPELILYRETKNLKPGFAEPSAIAVDGENIWVAGDNRVIRIDASGRLLLEIPLTGKPKALDVAGEKIWIALENRIVVFDTSGSLILETEVLENGSLITGIVAGPDWIFVADAGKRRIIRYSPDGTRSGEFLGKANDDVLHGFIIPSPYFDTDINLDGDLWVVNPGLHALENYTPEGNLREHWQKTGVNIEGFSGCCNPAHFAFLPDGNFVTSEKGLVRIKIHKASGEFLGVVAPPSSFNEEGEAPDVATDQKANVYALDFDRKIIRIFEPN